LPTPTYTPLATITLTSSASSVTFASIPTSGYRDLIVVSSANNNGSTGTRGLFIQFNADTGSNYSWVQMEGNGSTATSETQTAQVRIQIGQVPISNRTMSIANIMDYSATNKHKSIISRFDTAADRTNATASRWASTSAITSLRLFPNADSFAVGSTFSVYGIAA